MRIGFCRQIANLKPYVKDWSLRVNNRVTQLCGLYYDEQMVDFTKNGVPSLISLTIH